jgi:hypothetical protein
MKSWLPFVVCASCCAVACMPPSPAVENAERPTLDSGEPGAPPAMAVLPELPPGATVDSARTHHGLLAARETLERTMPTLPADRSYLSLQRWVDDELVSWLERRRDQTDVTRSQFTRAGEGSDSERAVQHAALGLIHEDTALSLGRIPAPAELDREPEFASMYDEIVRARVDMFLQTALVEFRDCANDAYRAPKDMRGWASFCHARFKRLQAQILESRKRAREAHAAAPAAQ